MADDKLSKLLETQISLTEWLAKIGSKHAESMREEDNVKRVRIGQISKITGMPFDKPTTFDAQELIDNSPSFRKFLEEKGNDLCALRLIPKKGVHAEKLRNRGLSVKNVMAWFKDQNIDASLYDADFVPHIGDYSWATIFVVNEHGIYGEIYYGGHHILTQGFHEKEAPISFGYDFITWSLSPAKKDAEVYLKEMIDYIHITDSTQQQQLKVAVSAEFTHDYIKGYFETTHSKVAGTWFIDYNRILGAHYADYVMQTGSSTVEVKGRVASKGEAIGKVKIITDPAAETISEDEILVCAMTTPDYIPHMVKAKGVVTDMGGILCHAAIVARELHKPCIVGTGNATATLKNGDTVSLNTESGEVIMVITNNAKQRNT